MREQRTKAQVKKKQKQKKNKSRNYKIIPTSYPRVMMNRGNKSAS